MERNLGRSRLGKTRTYAWFTDAVFHQKSGNDKILNYFLVLQLSPELYFFIGIGCWGSSSLLLVFFKYLIFLKHLLWRITSKCRCCEKQISSAITYACIRHPFWTEAMVKLLGHFNQQAPTSEYVVGMQKSLFPTQAQVRRLTLGLECCHYSPSTSPSENSLYLHSFYGTSISSLGIICIFEELFS